MKKKKSNPFLYVKSFSIKDKKKIYIDFFFFFRDDGNEMICTHPT